MDGGVVVDDRRIVMLFLERNEQGLSEAKNKYGNYCRSIAYGVLRDWQDAEECESDTYLVAWNVIPPQQPTFLAAFLGRITRNLSLKKLRTDTAAKRGGNAAILSLEELSDCIPAGKSFEEEIQAKELADTINKFLRNLPELECKAFILRYWYCDTIKEIAGRFGFTQSKVKMMLLRIRMKLREYLIKEEIFCEKE